MRWENHDEIKTEIIKDKQREIKRTLQKNKATKWAMVKQHKTRETGKLVQQDKQEGKRKNIGGPSKKNLPIILHNKKKKKKRKLSKNLQ